jgi:hypothetical protein
LKNLGENMKGYEFGLLHPGSFDKIVLDRYNNNLEIFHQVKSPLIHSISTIIILTVIILIIVYFMLPKSFPDKMQYV